jgi:hypothetical protein
MAPTQPSNGQPGPPHEPVDLESFEGIGRTGGDITAGRNPACEHPLIAAHTPCRQTRRKGKATRRVSRGQRIVIVLTDPTHRELPTRRSRQLSTSRKRTSRSAVAALGWIDPGLEPRSDRRAPGGASDCAPPQFRQRGTLRTRHEAARRRSVEMEPTWSPTRCHYGPDGRGAAVLGTCGGHELARSGRQTSTALEPARPQNIASGACGHAGTEAMLLRPAADIGLERTFHEGPPRSTEPRRGPQIVAS